MSVVHNLAHVSKTECARAIDPVNGQTIVVSHVKYNMVHPATGSDEEFYVEHIGSDGIVNHASGWESEAQALRHVTGYPEDATHSVFGKDVSRKNLGIPDGLLIRSSYSLKSDDVRKERERVEKEKAYADAAAEKKRFDDAVNAAVTARTKDAKHN